MVKMVKYKAMLQINLIGIAWLNWCLAWFPTCYLRAALLRVFFDVSMKSYIHRGVELRSLRGDLTIKEYAVIGPKCVLDNRRGIYIGRNVNIAANSVLLTLGHNLQDPDRDTIGAEVRILDGAYIFTGAMVLPGVVMGQGTALGAGSVLTKSTGEEELWAGNPAKFRKNISHRSDKKNAYWYFFAI